MYIQEVLKMIEEGEGTSIEFKRKLKTPEKIAKEICAFANPQTNKMVANKNILKFTINTN